MSTERLSFNEDNWQTDPASYENLSVQELHNHIASKQRDIDAGVEKAARLIQEIEATREEIVANRAVVQALYQAQVSIQSQH